MMPLMPLRHAIAAMIFIADDYADDAAIERHDDTHDADAMMPLMLRCLR